MILDTVFYIQLVLFTFAGAFIGTIIGMLPGIGSATTLAIMLPFIVPISPMFSIPIMAAIYYGSQYGGSTTSILFKVPGEISGAVICQDGHALYQQGRGLTALRLAAYSSFVAGIFTTGFVYVLSHVLLPFVTFFTPSELFMLSALGLYFSTASMGTNRLLVIASAVIGIMISFVGINDVTGSLRYTGGALYLYEGLGLAIIIAGVFGGSEVLYRFGRHNKNTLVVDHTKLTNQLMSKEEKKSCTKSVARGTVVGSLVGLIPGGGAFLGSVFSYAIEKFFVKDIGQGKLEAIAGPEAANNSAAQSGFIPLFVLGIPENVILSIIFGIMIYHGIPIGYGFLSSDWLPIVLASMILGNIMLLIINLPMLKISLHLYRIPERTINIGIVLLLLIGIYSIDQNIIDVVVLLLSSAVGLIFKKADIPILPMVMGFILGPYLEDRFIKSMIISDGNLMVFFETSVFAVSFAIFCAWLVFLIAKKTFYSRRTV
jgi:putative tricarboxylic transport membrane protein